MIPNNQSKKGHGHSWGTFLEDSATQHPAAQASRLYSSVQVLFNAGTTIRSWARDRGHYEQQTWHRGTFVFMHRATMEEMQAAVRGHLHIHKTFFISQTRPTRTWPTRSMRHVTLHGSGMSKQGPGKKSLGDSPQSLLWPDCQGALCSVRGGPHRTKPCTKSGMSFCMWQHHYVEQDATDDFSFKPNIPNKSFAKLLTKATLYTSDSFKFKVDKSCIRSNLWSFRETCSSN